MTLYLVVFIEIVFYTKAFAFPLGLDHTLYLRPALKSLSLTEVLNELITPCYTEAVGRLHLNQEGRVFITFFLLKV